MRIVLVEPTSCGNIGSVARVMKNTGLSDLALVNVSNWDTSETRALAHGACEILDNATIYQSLTSAIADCTWVIGTTNRPGKNRNEIHEPANLIKELHKKESSQSIAAVFGREKDGLSQDELQHCNFLVKFPSAGRHPSYNLSHAVLLLAYQYLLLTSTRKSNVYQTKSTFANQSDREHMFEVIMKALDSVDFKHYNGDKKHFLRPLKRFFNKFDLTIHDMRVLLKICNQVIHFSKRFRS
ncbi:MAG: RNA methyltransferase [Candidatus Latescibacterota bacterium]|nr:RNA methyltransferase [Candidatus Latescibacterota bacterium]